MALTTAAVAQAQNAATPAEANTGTGLQEVTVTAQRRAENVLDIPYNISAISGASLLEHGATNLTDLGALVPGLEVVDSGPATRGNTNSFALRGLRTDSPVSSDYPLQTVSSVSTYFGETPIFFSMPLVDIQRVEILRGPQGTLYGSGAEGGTIRFIPNRPDFQAFSAQVSVAPSHTDNAHGANVDVSGVVNIPLSDTLALRAVAGNTYLRGFITDVGLAVRGGPNPGGPIAPPVPRVPGDPTSGFLIAPPLRDANSSNQWFARLALRWAPADHYDFELGYVHQRTRVDDAQQGNPIWPGGSFDLATAQVPPFPNSSYEVPPGGLYRNTALIRQPYEDTIDLASLVATVDLGLATFTSATSVFDHKSSGTDDFTFQYYNPIGTNFISGYANFPRFIAYEPIENEERSFVQELRLVSKWTKPIDYVVGAYFQRLRDNLNELQPTPGILQYIQQTGFTPTNPAGITSDSVFNDFRNQDFKDRAVFGDVTWHITPKWQVTGGTRFFWQSFDVAFLQTVPFCGSVCGIGPLGETSVQTGNSVASHIWKLNTSYDLAPEAKLYFTYAEGFRRGGANGVPLVGNFASLPTYLSYAPDLAKNYEFGIKGTAVDQRLRYTADVFLINLENFQFNSYTPSFQNAVFNGAEARSKGAELELESRLTQRLQAQIAYTYTEAYATKAVTLYDLPSYATPGTAPVLNINIPAGTRLPGVPTHAATLGVDYLMPGFSTTHPDWSLNWHVSYSYRNAAPAAIPSARLPAWTLEPVKVLGARVTLDSGRAWSLSLFGTNLTNDPGISGGTGVQTVPNPLAYQNVMRPRTIGLEYDYRVGGGGAHE